MSASFDTTASGAPRIAVLPSEVADQIAAGEVVERPASVVKELIENALDAGATSIDLEVEDGGRRRIRVSDDGIGMGRDDAVLALSRGTPPRRSATRSDLVGVASFGFRGEALPAICSVSQLEIETASVDGAGTRVRAAGGTVAETVEAARRRGTTVTVAHLFYNAPARLKFLRGARSEWRAILDVVTNVALTRRDVRLTVTHDGKDVIVAARRRARCAARLAALWGADVAERLLDVDDVRGATRVSRARRASRRRRHRRPPRVHLRERPRRARPRHRARGRDRLPVDDPGRRAPHALPRRRGRRRRRGRERAPGEGRGALPRPVAAGTRRGGRGAPRARHPRCRGGHRPPARCPFRRRRTSSPSTSRPCGAAEPPGEGLFADRTPGDISVATSRPRSAHPRPGEEPAVPIPPLMQLRRTYIMFEREGGVVLIDQHSAHERVLYEQFMRVARRGANRRRSGSSFP